MARSRGVAVSMAGAWESVYDTAPGLVNYQRLLFRSTNMSGRQPLERDVVLGVGRSPQDPVRGLVDVVGDVSVPLDDTVFGWWLKGLLGQPQTTGVSDYTHTFTNDGTADPPSFALETAHAKVPRYFMASGCFVNRLTLPFQPAARPAATVNVVGRREAGAGTSAAGTPVATALGRFSSFQGAISVDDTPLATVESANLVIANNMERATVIDPNGLAAGHDAGMLSVSGNVRVRFTDMALLDAASAGTPIDLDLAYTIGAANALDIACPRIFLPQPEISVSGPGGVIVDYAFETGDPDAANAITIVLKNQRADYDNVAS